MDRGITFAGGVSRACIAAGPAFIAAMVVFTALAVPNVVAVHASSLLLLFILVPVIMVGALLALLPNLLGTALLARMARDNAGLRLPAV